MAGALYLQTPFVQALESLGLERVINLKDNQPDLAAEAGLLTNRPAGCRDARAQEEFELWHLTEVDWPVADRLVRAVKTVRVQDANRVAVRKQNGQPIREKQPAHIMNTNFYATNVDLGAIPPQFILETAVGGLPNISTPAAASICTESSPPQTGELRSS